MRPCPPVDLPAEAPAEPGVEADVFREAMRRVASPVVVVTVEPEGQGPRGATIGSFTSLALEPPLVSFNVTRDSRLHDALRATRRFAVHLLAADQADLAARFADPNLDGEAQLAPYRHRRPGGGTPPVLEDALGVLLCHREKCVTAGDHSIFVGRVYHVIHGHEGPPLVYHARAYGTVERVKAEG